MNKFFDIAKYKTDINLPDFLLANDFVHLKEKSGGRYHVFSRDEKNQCFVCYRNKQNFWVYFDADSPNRMDGGHTIIDFVLSELQARNKGIKLTDALKIIDQYYNNNTFPDSFSAFNVSNTRLSPDQIENIFKKQFTPAEDLSYLDKRGISDVIYLHPNFRPLLFNWQRTNKETEQTSNTLASFMYGVNENYGNVKSCLLSVKEGEKCHCFGSRSESLWASNCNKDKPLDKLIINESFIDSISHYEIFNNELKTQNVRYLSTQGQMTERQENLICNIIEDNKPKETIIATDNDVKGFIYRAKILASPILSKAEDATAKNCNCFIYSSKTHGFLEISLASNFAPESDFQSSIAEHFSSDKNFNIDFTNDNNIYNAKISFTFYGSDDVVKWKDLCHNIMAFKNISENIKNHYPLTNDYNDDLRCLKGAHPKYFISKQNDQFILNEQTDKGSQAIKPVKDTLIKEFSIYPVTKQVSSGEIKL